MIPPVKEVLGMTTYIHHISGRLRTRYPQLKNHPARAKAAESAISRIKGVLSVEASTTTGSLLIRYDAYGPDRDAVIGAIHHTKQQLGLMSAQGFPMSVQVPHVAA